MQSLLKPVSNKPKLRDSRVIVHFFNRISRYAGMLVCMGGGGGGGGQKGGEE